MKTFVIVTLIVVVLFAAGGFAFAKYRGVCSGPEGRSQWFAERVTQRLQLNAAQSESLEALRQLFLSKRGDALQARSEGRALLRELLSAPELDRERAQSRFLQFQEELAIHSRELIDAVADFTDRLNPQQRQTLVEWMERHQGRRFGSAFRAY